ACSSSDVRAPRERRGARAPRRRSDFAFAGPGQAGARAMDDQEPEREAEGTYRGGDREDPPQRPRALVVPGRPAHEDPRVVHSPQDRKRAEQEREQPDERNEDAEAHAARQIVG